MTPNATVSFEDLLAAFDWASAGAPMENTAFLSRLTGATHCASMMMGLDDDLPDDIEDASIYLAVPHKNDLDLGKQLALNFADDLLPESYGSVAAFFRQRGAYGRFKDFLERRGMLQAWYDYEAKAVERALREWAAANGLPLKP